MDNSKSKKSALVTGVSGQDGAYLTRFLLDKGYEVYGTVRRVSSPNLWRLQYMEVLDKIKLIPGDMTDMASLMEAIEISDPDEVYNLAAQSFVAASFESPISTGMVDGLAPMQMLDIIRLHKPKAKFYQASTSELYGRTGKQGNNLDEEAEFVPNSPYAAAKLMSFHATRIYREAYGLFAVNGILFNHESPLRGLEFVTRKVTNAAAKISLGLQKELHLGNLDAIRDWGYAKEYVEAMWMMLQHSEPVDFVIATGEAHTVRELCQFAFQAVDLDWEKYVKTDKSYLRPLEVNYLLGDAGKAKREIGWEAKTKFEDLITIMVKEDVKRWKMQGEGKLFPWDAPNFPDAIDVKYLTRALKV